MGDRHVPAPVHEVLKIALGSWKDEDMGLSRPWVYDLSRDLAEEQQPSAWLVLFIPLVSPVHRVNRYALKTMPPPKAVLT